MSNRRHRNGSRPRRWRSAPGPRSEGILAPMARLLLRVLFALPRRLAQPQAGFILPTVVLLLLVVSLTVGSITLRTFTRTSQAIGDRQQQIIYNAATPAIDRARAKLEYLFNQDERLPSGVPGEDTLFAMMANDTAPFSAATKGGNPANPYLFDDETALDITNSGLIDASAMASGSFVGAVATGVQVTGEGSTIAGTVRIAPTINRRRRSASRASSASSPRPSSITA